MKLKHQRQKGAIPNNNASNAKEAIHLAAALLILYGDLTLTPRQLVSLLKVLEKLWFRLKDKKRFILYLAQFGQEAYEQGIPMTGLGKYVKKLLRAERLPKLFTVHPFLSVVDGEPVPPRWSLR